MTMNDYSVEIKHYLAEVKQIADEIPQLKIQQFIDSIITVRNYNGRVFFAGVGGSAANASHAVNDFRKILNIDSYCVSDNVSELTARTNDQGWQNSYSGYLMVSRMSSLDVLVVLSVGGGSDTVSQNLVSAIKYARSVGATVLSIVSRNGGYAASNSHVSIMVPVVNNDLITPHAEEWQGVLLHLVVSVVSKIPKYVC